MSLKPRQVNFDSTWANLLETVEGVITCGSVDRNVWNDRFTDVYALCVANPESYSDRLYVETKSFLQKHVQGLKKNISTSSEMAMLARYHQHWEEFSKGSKYLNRLYGYLNSQCIRRLNSRSEYEYGSFMHPVSIDDQFVDGIPMQMVEVGELALDIWREEVIEPLQKTLVELLFQEIQKDRCHDSVNQAVVHGVVNSFVSVEEYKKKAQLRLYENIFETPFLTQTGEYYKAEGLALLDKCTVAEYMEKVLHKLDDENLRSRKFLHPSSYAKVTKEFIQRLLADHLQFIHAECEVMVRKEKRKDISNMFRLLLPIENGLTVLIKELESHIKMTGLEAISSLKGDNIPHQFVGAMLDVHSHFTELIKVTFNSDQQFVAALDRACAEIINHRTNPKTVCKSPELLAKYCDSLLKKSAKGLSETEIDDRLTNSITVFKYLDDKDIFQRFYARMLARRLIYNQSTSRDAEEAMITRLKQACGYEFTNKLHRMYNDMTISEDLNNKFADFCKAQSTSLGLNFVMSVLQAGAWPIGQSNLPKFAIPQELERSVDMFEKFYNQQFNGRKLTWLHNFSNADLKMNHLKRTYFVTMGTYHMSLLLPFNTADVLTLKDLLEITQMQEKELEKQLQTLLETKIILADSANFSEAKLTLNMDYSNKRTKFKIMGVVQKEANQEVEQTHTAVEEDRKMYLQAAIVRIMKARKQLKHNLLIQEVISQSKARFAPSVSMIKKCIETLIDKQYLERSTSRTDEYSYVA